MEIPDPLLSVAEIKISQGLSIQRQIECRDVDYRLRRALARVGTGCGLTSSLCFVPRENFADDQTYAIAVENVCVNYWGKVPHTVKHQRSIKAVFDFLQKEMRGVWLADLEEICELSLKVAQVQESIAAAVFWRGVAGGQEKIAPSQSPSDCQRWCLPAETFPVEAFDENQKPPFNGTPGISDSLAYAMGWEAHVSAMSITMA